LIKKALIPFAFQSFPVIKDIFHITVIFNTGAAFGILRKHTFLLIMISLFFILLLFFLAEKEGTRSKTLHIAYGLIMGGAGSNLFDRIFYGHVIDYLDFRIWPVFNLSDSCICIGVGLVLVHSIKEHYREKKDSHHS